MATNLGASFEGDENENGGFMNCGELVGLYIATFQSSIGNYSMCTQCT